METEGQILQQQALHATSTIAFGNSDSSRLRRSNVERQREYQDALMNCVTQDLGFSEEKPVAAYTIFKCLVHWRSFETERTIVFDCIIQVIGSAIEDESNNDRMVYWLSNTSTLLFLLQQAMKATASKQHHFLAG